MTPTPTNLTLTVTTSEGQSATVMRPGPTSGDLPIEVATLFGFAVGRLMSKSKLIDIREAARTLGVSVGALRKRVQRGHLPRGAVVYEGRRYYFRPERLGV